MHKQAKYTSEEGTIVIVDISGFTQLVYNTDLITGKDILLRLLSTIIQKNRLSLNISEIEGDAVLFYKFGAPPSYQSILEQFELMLKGFIDNLKSINNTLDKPMQLSLKMIVHYGPFTEYSIANFSKLYGVTVMESHLLLKNQVNSHSYVLMTNDFFNNTTFGRYKPNYPIKNEQCEILRGIKQLCYHFLDFSLESGMAS